jgi:hypothetical protein
MRFSAGCNGRARAYRQKIVAAAIALAPALASAQPCNPAIDGTYCAEARSRTRTNDPFQTPITMTPIREFGSAMSGGTSTSSTSSIGTFAGISFRGGTTCIGLMRRGNCN